jgi:hypothetical protein
MTLSPTYINSTSAGLPCTTPLTVPWYVFVTQPTHRLLFAVSCVYWGKKMNVSLSRKQTDNTGTEWTLTYIYPNHIILYCFKSYNIFIDSFIYSFTYLYSRLKFYKLLYTKTKVAYLAKENTWKRNVSIYNETL